MHVDADDIMSIEFFCYIGQTHPVDDRIGAVSYTHLDVYKRQVEFN